MRKSAIMILVILAVATAPLLRSVAARSGPCPGDPIPLPEALHAVIMEAEQASERDDFPAAAAIVEAYLERHKGETHPYPYYEAGYFLHKAGRREAAVEYLQKAVGLDPCFTEAWQLMASIHQEAGQSGRAATALEKAADTAEDPELWYQTAVLWLDAGIPKKALNALAKLRDRRPGQADWHVAAARAHQELKQSAGAAEAMISAHALSQDPEHLYQAALFWLEAEKPGQALPLLRKLTGTPSPKFPLACSGGQCVEGLEKDGGDGPVHGAGGQNQR